MNATALLGDPTLFLNRLFAELSSRGLDASDWPLDHVCYRVETEERYGYLKEQLLGLGKLISDKVIGGRPISVFLLEEPYGYQGRRIDCLELPAPKPSKSYREGYEHAEFVLAEALEDFMSRHPQLGFDIKGLQKAINPDLRLNFGDINVKFHRQSLEYVIKYLE